MPGSSANGCDRPGIAPLGPRGIATLSLGYAFYETSKMCTMTLA